MNKALLDELLQLPPAERLELAKVLRASVDSGDVALTDEQIAECELELAAHNADPSSSIPWEEVRAELWSRSK